MSTCEKCQNHTEKESPQFIPFVAHEKDMARMDLANKRLWILLLIVMILFVVSNALWFRRENQFTDTVETSYDIEQDTDGGGNNYVVGGDFNGEAKDQSQNQANQNP